MSKEKYTGHTGFVKTLVAPCGMNCWTCLAYLRNKNRCEGCRSTGTNKCKHCITCSILNCDRLAETTSEFCYDCRIFPCKRLKDLDKRYRTKYNTSLLENLAAVRSFGPDEYIKRELEKWHCTSCGGTICVHRGFCLQCNN